MSNYMAEVGPAACTHPYMDAYTHTVLGRTTGPCVLLALVRVNLGITNPNLNQKMQQPIPFNTQAQRHQTCRRFRFQHNRNILWHLYMGLYGYRSCSPAAASIFVVSLLPPLRSTVVSISCVSNKHSQNNV